MEMDSSIQDSPRNLRRVINKKLRKLETSARVLKLRRNALVPISHLAPEVLEIIFSFLFLPEKFEPSMTGGKRDRLAWLRVSHVCHRWREIALNQPRFWSRINFNTLTLAGVTCVLSRSKMAPLVLEANLSDVYWDWYRQDTFRKQLMDHISHISQLNIIADSLSLNSVFRKLVSPAPILDSLSVIVNNITSSGMEILTKIPLPLSLFDGMAPRLSILRLTQCEISWTSPLLKACVLWS
jgi:F-box-like